MGTGATGNGEFEVLSQQVGLRPGRKGGARVDESRGFDPSHVPGFSDCQNISSFHSSMLVLPPDW
jgi:hypothetical protein